MSLRGVGDDDLYTDEDVVEIVARQQELNFTPGERFLYSNSGCFLVPQLVERVAGLSLREYAAARLFEPLGMAGTHFHDDHAEVVPRRAVGYAPCSEGGFRIHTTRLNMVGDGGVFTSIEEMARWERFLMGWDIAPSLDFLRDGILEQGVLNDGDTIPYAFGVQHGEYRGLPTVSHGGSFVGYRAHVLRFPGQSLSVVVLCNVSSADPGGLARQVAEVFLEGEMGPAPPSPSEPQMEEDDPDGVPRPSPRELTAYAGEWWSEELQVRYRLEVESDTLRLVEPVSRAGPLIPVGADTFRLRGVTFRFVEDGSGEGIRELRLDAGRALNVRFVPAESDVRPGRGVR